MAALRADDDGVRLLVLIKQKRKNKIKKEKLGNENKSNKVQTCENTVLTVPQVHFTSMKYELGAATRRFFLWVCFSASAVGCRRSFSMIGCWTERKTQQ